MFCKSCGTQVADTERFCPNCGTPLAPAAQNQTAPAQSAPQGAPKSPALGKGISIGKIKLSFAQLLACCASIVGLLAFLFYFFAPRRVSYWGVSGGIGYGDFFKGTGYTGFFYVIGAIFTFIAIALVAVPVVLQIINKNDSGEYEFHAIPFVLYFIAFIINIITTITLNSQLSGMGSISFWHILYLLFSLIFLAYCAFSAFMAFKANNNKIKLTILGITLFEQK